MGFGPAKGLYAEAFYRQVERALAPAGVFALHAESPWIVRDTFFQVFQQLAQVFPMVRPLFVIVVRRRLCKREPNHDPGLARGRV